MAWQSHIRVFIWPKRFKLFHKKGRFPKLKAKFEVRDRTNKISREEDFPTKAEDIQNIKALSLFEAPFPFI